MKRKNILPNGFVAAGIVLVLCLSAAAHAFLPPVANMIAGPFEGRKNGKPIECLVRYRVHVSGEIIDWEEQLLATSGKVFLLWRGAGTQMAASWDRRSYVVAGSNQRFPSRSSLFLRYLASNSADEFREALVAEGFVRRDQLLQFKPSYAPTGDPRSWDVKGSYLRHPDVYLSRTQGLPALVVQGTNENGLAKSVHFDQSLRGIQRLQWTENGKVANWNFAAFSENPQEGVGARVLQFQSESGMAQGEVVYRRTPNSKQLGDFQTRFKSMARESNFPEAAEKALSLLLSYR